MNTVDEYLETVTPAQKVELQRVRGIIKKLVPEIEESISYGMPTFKYKGKQVLLFAAFKNHMSLFGDVDVVKDKLPDFVFSDKGTLQFSESKPVPEEALQEIINTRLKDV